MSVKNIILSSVLAIVVLAAGSVIGCYFHYNNQEISLRPLVTHKLQIAISLYPDFWIINSTARTTTDNFPFADEIVFSIVLNLPVVDRRIIATAA